MCAQKQLFQNNYEKELAAILSTTSPFSKVYWFAYILIGREYGGIGANNKIMAGLSMLLEVELKGENPAIDVVKKVIYEYLSAQHRVGTKQAESVNKLIEELDELIVSITDLSILHFTIVHVVTLLNSLIHDAPKEDRKIAESLIKGHLDKEGEAGLANAITLWDKAGKRGNMDSERGLIVAGFRILRKTLEEMIANQKATPLDADYVLTAFVQEYERRLSRGVRPGRAGRSLEDVTGVILAHFKVDNYEDAPSHIKRACEVDKLIKLPDGWKIGVSCKRTFRERWKQATTLNNQILDENKIKAMWHVVTYTSDLSRPIILAIGESRGIVYVPNASHFYNSHIDDKELQPYLRPMTEFIQNLKSID